jgi:putative transposase
MSFWMPAYSGRSKGKDWIERTLGWSAEIGRHRPRYKKANVTKDILPDQIDWSKYLPPPSFQILPRRRVVERTFGWQAQARRLSRDYQLLGSASRAMIYVRMLRLMLQRLIRR